MAAVLAIAAGIPVLAEAKPTVLVAPDGVTIEEEATVEVRLRGFEDLRSAVFWLEFDQSLVEAVESTIGDIDQGIFGATTPAIDNERGTVSLAWAHSHGIEMVDATFFSVVFRSLPAKTTPQTLEFTFFAGAGTIFEDSYGNRIVHRSQLGTAMVTASSAAVQNSGSDQLVPDKQTVDDDSNSSFLSWATPDDVKARNGAAAPEPTLTVSPSQVAPGQDVSVSARLCNTGTETASRTVSLLVNGAEDQSQSVTVEAGQCREVQFTTSRTDEGNYTVAVDEMTGEFTVVPAAVPPPPPHPPGQEMPGATESGINTTYVIIAAAGAALVVIAALLFFLRRR